ncbi:MAG: hypothetical protein HQ541_16730 [Mariniphaga sp.]|nr:hypothetical protein [Mariniphaga sp.]
MIGKFFYIPKSKRFNITPRFHDPDQEERDAREQRIKGELGIEDEKLDNGKPFRPNIKGQFRDTGGWQSKSSPDARRSSNTRLIILILIFTLIAYLLFFSDFNLF